MSNEENLFEELALLQLICSASGAARGLVPRRCPVAHMTRHVHFVPVTRFSAEVSWGRYWTHSFNQIKKTGFVPTETHKENGGPLSITASSRN